MSRAATLPATGHASAGQPQDLASLDDAGLIESICGERPQEAFRELVRRHHPRVKGLLVRMTGDPATAEDLAQEVFIRAFRGLRTFEGRARLSTWLYRIAFNLCVNHRARGRSFEALGEGERWAERPEHALGTAARSDLRRDLDRALATLPQAYRAALVLCYFDDLSYPEIAAVLDLPLGTVKTHIHRAKRALRAALEGWEGGGLS